MNKISKGNRLMVVYEHQFSFQRHKKKLQTIANRTKKFSCHSQLDFANSYKKHFQRVQAMKHASKQKKIQLQNQKLHHFLMKQYNRKNKNQQVTQRYAQRVVQSRQLRRSKSQKRVRQVKQQNARLLQRILVVDSQLSKQKLQRDYKKLSSTKSRMEVYSSSSRKRLSDGLKKMHIKPTVYFPKVRNEKKSNISRKSSRKI